MSRTTARSPVDTPALLGCRRAGTTADLEETARGAGRVEMEVGGFRT